MYIPRDGIVPEPELQPLELREIYHFFVRRWKAIFCAAAVTCGLFIAAAHFITPSYQASAQILFANAADYAVFHEPSNTEFDSSSTFIDSQIAVLNSTSILGKVIAVEGLADDPDMGQQVLQWLRNSVHVSRVGLSNVVELSVTHERPERAKSIANAIADAYVQDRIDSRYEAAKEASRWLSERAELLRAELSRSEETIEKFRIAHNLLATRQGTLTEQQLSELNIALINARADSSAKRSKYGQAEKLLRTGGDVQSMPDVLQSDVISALRAQHAAVTRRTADLLSRYGQRHPEVMTAEAERIDIENQIAAEIQRLIGNLKNEVEAAQAREVALADALASVSSQSEIEGHVGVQLRDLERIAAANKQLYEAFLARAKMAEERSTLLDSGVRVITRAELPDRPRFPNKRLFAALGLVFGVSIGTGVALLRELTASAFLAGRQVEEALALPVLASIPRLVDRSTSSDSEAMPVTYLKHRPLSRYSEAVRKLRSGLHRDLEAGAPPRVILVTSAILGEGKTFLALSLAHSAAADGERALIIDADLRRPAATSYFGGTSDVGLVDLLTLPIELESAVHLDERSGIQFLPSGASTHNPPALLASRRMRTLIDELSRRYDTIIIDAPPVGSVSDAAILARYVDKVILAVKWGETSREVVAEGIRQLGSRSKIAGIALTMVDEPQLPTTGRYASIERRISEAYYVN